MLHMPSNRTAQQKLQHRTKLYNKEHNALHNNIYQKMIFLAISISIQTVSREIPLIFLSRVSFMNIHDLEDSRGRGRLSL